MVAVFVVFSLNFQIRLLTTNSPKDNIYQRLIKTKVAVLFPEVNKVFCTRHILRNSYLSCGSEGDIIHAYHTVLYQIHKTKQQRRESNE